MPKSSSASSCPSSVVMYTVASLPAATAPQPWVDAPKLGVQAAASPNAIKPHAVKISSSHRDGVRAADATAAAIPAAVKLREGGRLSVIAIWQFRMRRKST